MSEWITHRIGDITKLSYGKMPDKQKLGKGIYPTFSGYKYQYRYPKKNCSKGDIIVVARGVGGTGDVKIVKEDCYLTNLSIKMSFDDKIIDNKFAYYYFLNNNLRYLDSGSAQSQITIKDLENESFSFPAPDEQKAIAGVLSSLDDKIDLLQRQNKTLEAMVETLFRQWVIEEAEDDWERGFLSDEFDFIMGQSPLGKTLNEDNNGIPMFQGNADFGFRFPSNRVFTTAPTRYAEKYDTLISVRAPVGAQNMALEKCCIGRGVAAFRYRKNPSFYTYTYYKMNSLIDEIKIFNNEGTVFGSISKKDFQIMEIQIPPMKSILEFEELAKPINDKIIFNSKHIKNLTLQKDILLPKLMNGEIRVDAK